MECDMPVSCKFASFDNFQKSLLWTHKDADHALRRVLGLMLQIGDTQKFPHALAFKSQDHFSQSQQAGSMFHSRREGWL